jgi:hypothetical protein
MSHAAVAHVAARFAPARVAATYAEFYERALA